MSPRSGGEIREGASEVTLLGTISVSGKCGWDLLDSLVQRLFKEYVMRVDPASNLGLNSDSILNYVVGEVSREAGGARPEYLPYGYLVGDTTSIALNLASVHSYYQGCDVSSRVSVRVSVRTKRTKPICICICI